MTYVGPEVHKETIAVALAEAGKRGVGREFGTIANTQTVLKVLTSKLARSGAASSCPTHNELPKPSYV